MIFINGKFLAQPITGVQRYALQIVEQLDALLEQELWATSVPIVLLVPSQRVETLPTLRRIAIREVPSGRLHAWEQLHLPRAARGGTLLNLAGSAPLLKLQQICTFHDTAVFDFPEAYSRAFTLWYRLLFKAQGILSRRLLTVSEFSRSRLSQHLGVSPDKIGVVPGAADHMAAQAPDASVLGRFNLRRGDYLLAVGSANPTKNFPRLIQAFGQVPDPNAQLVVVGGSNNAVFAASADHGVEEDTRIVRTGRLSDAELKSLYMHARAYVFPSLYEGFGLPPIEAMLCGCPVLAAHAASIPEICGPAAGYFDPFSLASMRDAMSRALRDDAWLTTLRVAGAERAKRFSWQLSATGLLQQLAQLGLARPLH